MVLFLQSVDPRQSAESSLNTEDRGAPGLLLSSRGGSNQVAGVSGGDVTVHMLSRHSTLPF